MLDGDRDCRLPVERDTARDHLIERDAEGVDIGSCVRKAASDLLRRAVVDRTHRVCADRVGGCRARDAEIRDLDLSVCGNDDILRLHIAVNDALVMGGRKAHADLNGDAGCLPDGELALLRDIFLQGDSLDKLHDNIVIALVLADVIDIDNVRICQPGCRLGLASELRDECAVA